MLTLTLTPGQVSFKDFYIIYKKVCAVKPDQSYYPTMEYAQAKIAQAGQDDEVVYEVNTEFGKLASVKIASQNTAILQRSLILPHCCVVGSIIPKSQVRLLMALKLLSLGRGVSGIRLSLVNLLEAFLKKDITPAIRAQGSVGASGDLVPDLKLAAELINQDEIIKAATITFPKLAS